jgi:hypothetical protein
VKHTVDKPARARLQWHDPKGPFLRVSHFNGHAGVPSRRVTAATPWPPRMLPERQSKEPSWARAPMPVRRGARPGAGARLQRTRHEHGSRRPTSVNPAPKEMTEANPTPHAILPKEARCVEVQFRSRDVSVIAYNARQIAAAWPAKAEAAGGWSSVGNILSVPLRLRLRTLWPSARAPLPARAGSFSHDG